MAIVLNPIVSRLVNTLIDLGNEELNLILGVPEEIQRLRLMLISIRAVLNDAEQQQITQEAVKLWLSNLRDVMYEADDVLDEYRIAAVEKASPEHPPEETSLGCRILPPFSCFRQVKFTHEIGNKIRDLNNRLEKISAIRSTLDLRVSDRRREVARVGRETSPVVEPDIVGEEIEKYSIYLLDLLIQKEKGKNPNVIVFAIVGIGGIGKTTLAQKIFSHHIMQAMFQKTMWVCVSQEFVETDLLREMITNAGGSPGEARSKADLESMVMHRLRDNKFLLVLDDVWDAQIWEDLFRKPLQVGAVGSRVLVTTRNQRVAEQMKASHIHQVQPLSLNDSWLLLRKKVTKNEEEESDVESLKDIGMKIVEKCQGLPLAIKTVGGVLCGKLSRPEWEQVDRSSKWSQTRELPKGVHQALYLSYECLPSHLKQCLLHCSLFREDSNLFKEILVQLWVAEGFVVEEQEFSPEEIAERYYDELIQRSLLLQTHEGGVYRYTYCKMHDLLRSLCHFLLRGESLVIKGIDKELPSNADDVSIKLRRLSILGPTLEDIETFLCLNQRHKSVRTLLLDRILNLDDKVIDNCFKNLQRLRIVHLGSTRIQSLPQSVGNLLHMRYLNLSFCHQVKTLPESIGSLKYLQFLILQGCINLHNLPKGVVKLYNMRALNLVDVPLEKLPSGMERLQHLNVLKGAVVSSIFSSSSSNNSSNSCSLEEISKLRKLRVLSIFSLWVTSANFDPNVNGFNRLLTALEDLVSLDLYCDSLGDSRQQVEIFDVALHPPSSVRHIQIYDFFGSNFPRWLMSSRVSSSLPNLTKLMIHGCRSCRKLPPLGKLPNLEELDLVLFHAVMIIGVEFYGYEEASTSVGHEIGRSKSALSSLPLFPRLKRLRLESLFELKEWQWLPDDGRTTVMPQLNELIIYSCPRLLHLPYGLSCQAFRLTKLSLVNNANLRFIGQFFSVKDLWISGETQVPDFSDLPALEVLRVHQDVKGWESHYFSNLGSLRQCTSLRRLQLSVTCENNELLSKYLRNGRCWSHISYIPVVQISDHRGNYINYIKHSSTFQTNII